MELAEMQLMDEEEERELKAHLFGTIAREREVVEEELGYKFLAKIQRLCGRIRELLTSRM